MQSGLGRGYRFGIIASSDNHAGMPGRSFANGDRQFATNNKGGLAAVYAEELTREAIFRSLRSRRCYGTTVLILSVPMTRILISNFSCVLVSIKGWVMMVLAV